MTDGGFRRDGTFVPLPEPEVVVLKELWRRAAPAEFARRGGLEEEAAAAMLAWPHSGFGAYLGPRIHEREALLRVARYAARAPVAESRLRYDAERTEVELVADRVDGPYAGVHRMTALELLARWVDHVPVKQSGRVFSWEVLPPAAQQAVAADGARWHSERAAAEPRSLSPTAIEPSCSLVSDQSTASKWESQ